MPQSIRHFQPPGVGPFAPGPWPATSSLGQRRMMPRSAQIAMSVALVLAGCTHLPGIPFQLDEKSPLAVAPAAQTAPVSQAPLIGPGVAIVLPKPREMGRSLEVAQLVTLRFAGQSLTFDARLSITPDRLVLVGIDGMGRRAMTVVWNGETMTVETAPWLPAAARPSSMLSDVVSSEGRRV